MYNLVKIIPQSCMRSDYSHVHVRVQRLSKTLETLESILEYGQVISGCMNGPWTFQWYPSFEKGVILFYGLWYLAVQPVPSNKNPVQSKILYPSCTIKLFNFPTVNLSPVLNRLFWTFYRLFERFSTFSFLFWMLFLKSLNKALHYKWLSRSLPQHYVRYRACRLG